MTISTEQLRAMIDNAAKATPGPYSFVPWHIAEGNSQVRVGRDLLCELSRDHTAQHIAACDPQTITTMAEELLMLRELTTARVLTCVYCGQAYPQDTPAHGAGVLTEHIKVCVAHPMRKAEEDIGKLRRAMLAMMEVETREELEAMRTMLTLMANTEPNARGALGAVNALLETMP